MSRIARSQMPITLTEQIITWFGRKKAQKTRNNIPIFAPFAHFCGYGLIGSALIIAILAPRAFAADPDVPGTNSTLRVGISPNMPPMIFKSGTNIVGIDADLARALGRELGRPIQFVEVEWPDLIDDLEADKIDIIMSSMSVTRARLTRVAFSDPYLRIGQMALVRTDEKYRYSPLSQPIDKQRLGVKKATTGDLVVQLEFPKAKRKYYDSGDDAAKALLKKKIDLYFDDSTMIWYLAGKYEADGLTASPLMFSDEQLAWAMRRSEPQLLQAVNVALKKIIATGELSAVLHRWIPKFE